MPDIFLRTCVNLNGATCVFGRKLNKHILLGSNESNSGRRTDNKMIYEILIRCNNGQSVNSDNLIWIESNLPTRSFEKWLMERQLLSPAGKAPVVRWGIVQTQRPAHFVLKTQAVALEQRIAALLNPSKRAKKSNRVQVMPNFAIPAFLVAA